MFPNTTICQLCGKKLGLEFVDGRTKMDSRWAIMCVPCHRTYGLGLGTGYGQQYRREDMESCAYVRLPYVKPDVRDSVDPFE